MYRTLRVLGPLNEACEAALRDCEALVNNSVTTRGVNNNQLEHPQFVREAAELAISIRESTLIYHFEALCDKTATEGRVFFLDDLKKYIIIDSKTGSALRPSAVPIAGPGGRVGEFLFTVRPALMRQATGPKEKIVLVKATVVVKFDHPVKQASMMQAGR